MAGVAIGGVVEGGGAGWWQWCRHREGAAA